MFEKSKNVSLSFFICCLYYYFFLLLGFMQNNQTAAVLHVSQVEEEASRHFLLTKCDLKLNSRASFLHCDSKTHLLLSCCSTKFTMKQEMLQTPGNIRLLSRALLWTS